MRGYSRRTPASYCWFGSGFTTSYLRCAKPSRTQTSPEAWKQLRTRWSRIGSQILRLVFNGRRSDVVILNAPGEQGPFVRLHLDRRFITTHAAPGGRSRHPGARSEKTDRRQICVRFFWSKRYPETRS